MTVSAKNQAAQATAQALDAESQEHAEVAAARREPKRPKVGPGGAVVGVYGNQQVYRPRTEAQIITFSCVIGGRGPSQHVSVLAGDGAPTVTGGWGRWNQVTRPGSTSLTTFDGYDPWTMDVPIQFEAVADDYGDQLPAAAGFDPKHRNNTSARKIEAQIALLTSFANRGPKAPSAGRGVPPLVIVSATAAKPEGNAPLVPAEVQNVDWVISSIAWDTNPIRNFGGYRIRQAATVSLMQYISGPFDASNNSTAKRAKQRQSDAGRFKTVGMRKGESYFGLARRISNGKNVEAAAKSIEVLNKKTHGAPHSSIHKAAAKKVNVKVPLAIFDGNTP